MAAPPHLLVSGELQSIPATLEDFEGVPSAAFGAGLAGKAQSSWRHRRGSLQLGRRSLGR